MTNGDSALPAHVEDSVAAVAKVHAAHYESASPLQRAFASTTAIIGRPGSVVVLTLAVIMWITVNATMLASGRTPFDEPPFPYLSGLVALAALYVTLLILITQRHDDELATRREQLTLQLAILSEQKAAKIISLIEELRQDHPGIRNRSDYEATAMSTAADPHSVLEVIRDRHEAVEEAAAQVKPDLTSNAPT